MYTMFLAQYLGKTAYFFNIPQLVNSYATLKTTQRQFPNMFSLTIQKKNQHKSS